MPSYIHIHTHAHTQHALSDNEGAVRELSFVGRSLKEPMKRLQCKGFNVVLRLFGGWPFLFWAAVNLTAPNHIPYRALTLQATVPLDTRQPEMLLYSSTPEIIQLRKS